MHGSPHCIYINTISTGGWTSVTIGRSGELTGEEKLSTQTGSGRSGAKGAELMWRYCINYSGHV